MIEQSISLERMEDTASLFGPFDENIRLIERELHVQIVIREEELRISGEAEQVMYAEKTIQSLLALGARGGEGQRPGTGRGLRHRCRKAHQGQDGGADRLRPCHPE